MKTPEKPKRLCEGCDHYEVCQVHSHAGVLHALNADRCGLYSDRTHDRNRIAVLEQVVEEGNMQTQQLEAANTELLTNVKQLEAKCHQLERERDAAVADLNEAKDCTNCKNECNCKSANYDCKNCNVADCPCKACRYEWRGVKEE